MAARSVAPAMGLPTTVPVPARAGATQRTAVRVQGARSSSFMAGANPVALAPTRKTNTNRTVTRCYAEDTAMPKLKVRPFDRFHESGATRAVSYKWWFLYRGIM